MDNKIFTIYNLQFTILCSYWSSVPTDPTVPTDPLFLLILLFLPILCSYRSYCSYCSYRSSVLTDSTFPTVPNDPLFLLILCSYWSPVPTDPLFLLFLPTDPLILMFLRILFPTVPTDPLFLFLRTDPLLLLFLLILRYYWSSVPTTDPFSLRCQSVALWRQSGRRPPAISRSSRWVITTCNSPLVHFPKSTLFAPKILHKHCFQFLLGRL